MLKTSPDRGSRRLRFAMPLAFALVTLVSVGAALGLSDRPVHLPNNHQGHRPEQPVAFSHALHAGTLGLDCLSCHSAADEGRHATVPSVEACMTCHTEVEGSSPRAREEIAKVRRASTEGNPIRWVRVHRFPDIAYFNHSAHVNKDIACQTCHGKVEEMPVMEQHSDLSMGWCVNCHREQNLTRPEVNAPLDCAACHR